jgi:methyltransferase-like protein
VQIDIAKERADAIGLSNMHFINTSILDVNKSFGEFDYIIVHGIISWVPEEVRSKILDICGELLSPNGVAYVSYNALPGWNALKSVRDMMLYHVSDVDSGHEKVSHAKLMMEFIYDSIPNKDQPYAQVLKKEMDMLSRHSDYYFRHDHLEDINHPYYFHEFMDAANERGLQYLSDASISSMNWKHLSQKTSSALDEFHDPIRAEQYMDFITNRRFRSTTMCKYDIELDRKPTGNIMEKFYMNIDLSPEFPLSEVDIYSDEQVKFFLDISNNINITSSSKYMKAALYTFAENFGKYISFDQLLDESAQKLSNAFDDEESEETVRMSIKRDFCDYAIQFLMSGNMDISFAPPQDVTYISDRPQVLPFARAQALHMDQSWVSNSRHMSCAVNLLDRYAMRYMDGINSKEDIAEFVMGHIESGEITLSKGDDKIQDPILARSEIMDAVEKICEKMLENHLLIG